MSYEAVIVFDSDLSDDALRDEVTKIENLIQAHGGSLEKNDLWGRRRLAYTIRKKEYGTYSVLVFTGDNSTVSDLDRQLKINESVLRHLIVVKDKYSPDFTQRLKEQNDSPVMFGDSDEAPLVDDFQNVSR